MTARLQDEVFRLRVRTRARWTQAARVATERRIEYADLHPPAFLPAAILLIRKLGKLPVLDIRQRSAGVWEDRVRSRINDLYRHAERPSARGIISDAAAVLFLDEAEMLACLAVTMTRAALPQPWWTPAAMSKLEAGASSRPLVLLARQPRLIPGVIAQLVDWQEAIAVLRTTESRDVAACFEALVREQALSRLLLECLGQPPVPAPASDRTESDAHPPAPPWSRLTQDLATDQLTVPAKLFLGVAMCAHVEPSRVRSQRFVLQAARWVAEALAAQTELARTETPSVAPGLVLREISEEPASRPPAAPGMVSPDEARVSEPRTRPQGIEGTRPANERRHADIGAEPLTAPWQFHTSPGALTGGVETRLGGLLYLVNLLEHLDLPDCFEESWGLASQFGPWALVELIGRALLDQLGEHFEDDPIWTVLAQLDGREGGLPGGGFRGRNMYRIPESWLDPDLPATVIRSAEAPFERTIPTLKALNPELLGWLGCAITFISWRLLGALRASSGIEVAKTLLLVRGRVFVTRTHIDLTAPLDAASARVRASGLDFNPGWSPRMGRIVLFHFG